MSDDIVRPLTLQINAWSEDLDNVDPLPARTPWAQRQQGEKMSAFLGPAAPADLRDWRHPDVGWGLVLPDPDDAALKPADRATAADAPAPIRELVASRPNSVVLRWGAAQKQGYLRRYYPDGRWQDLSIQAPNPGVQDGHIPRYLLIYASPKRIPWSVQYALNMSTFVGRLDLEGDGLDNYVRALISDWQGQVCRSKAPVVWSVDHGQGDITWLMARAVAGALWAELETDPELTDRLRLKGADGTAAKLVSALCERTPGLIVTTSHGVTGPKSLGPALAGSLGLPIDVNRKRLELADLAAWRPSGAIWYSHACCSAGADGPSSYATLLPTDGFIGRTLAQVADLAGPTVSPLPRALLGAEAPLRAFVGHVEPTFDWTLRDPATNQPLTHILMSALYDRLYQQDRRTPIGYALRTLFEEAGAFYGAWKVAIDGVNQNQPKARDWALYRQLVAMDRQTTVILGDPTVSLPPLS